MHPKVLSQATKDTCLYPRMSLVSSVADLQANKKNPWAHSMCTQGSLIYFQITDKTHMLFFWGFFSKPTKRFNAFALMPRHLLGLKVLAVHHQITLQPVFQHWSDQHVQV